MNSTGTFLALQIHQIFFIGADDVVRRQYCDEFVVLYECVCYHDNNENH